MSTLKVMIVTIMVTVVAGSQQTFNNCTECLKTTRMGQKVTKTLIYHTRYRCEGKIEGFCLHEGVTYSMCRNKQNKTICFDPRLDPNEYWLEVRAQGEYGTLLGKTKIENRDKPASVLFDACEAIDSGRWGGGCGSMEWV